jgi:hypothetical protein
MLPPFLLQAAATAGDLSIGAAITWVATALGIASAIYKLGVNSADTRNLKTSVTGALAEMNTKLDTITTHIDGNQQQRVQDAEWKGDMASRLSTVEREMALLQRRREP